VYYIYHIPGVKIGCSTNPNDRVKRQGYTEFKILESHKDIQIAAKREIELRNQYGYKENNVKTDYVQHYEYGKKGREAAKGLGAQSQIKNKVGIFGYSKEERLRLNTKANIIRAKISAEKRSKPVLVYDYKTSNFIGEWPSIKSASVELNANNLKMTIIGNRKHSNGYTAKLK
jgi:hypothetical protein